MENDAPNELHVEVTHPKGPLADLADGGKDFGEKVVQLGSVHRRLAELAGMRLEILVAERGEFRLEGIDALDKGGERFNVALAGVE